MIASIRHWLGTRLAVLALAVVAFACFGDGTDASSVEATAEVTSQTAAALSLGTIQWINGTYGAGCVARSGNWSVRVSGVATMTYAALSVVKNNTACVLTLTSIIADQTYAASPSIALTTSYQGSASSFAPSGGVSFFGNASLSATSFASNFVVSILYSDNPSPATGTLTGSYVSVNATSSTTSITAPDYTLDLTTGALTVNIDVNYVVQSVSGTANLVQGTIAGGGYYVDQGTLPASPTFAQLDTGYTSATTTTISGTPVQIPVSAFGLSGVNVSTPVVRTIVIQRNVSGVHSYETFKVTFGCSGTCGVSCPSGESSKSDSSGSGAINVCCASAATTLNCNGTCVNTLVDPSNCGSCGNACATGDGQYCTAGVCGVYSPTTYVITNQAGYVLENPGGGGVGTGVDQYTYVGANQQWVVTQVTTGKYKIIDMNGLALTAVSTNSQLVMQAYSGANTQLWYQYANGAYTNIVNVSSGQALDNWGGGVATIVGQWARDTNDSNQNWTLTTPASLTPPIANGTYTLTSYTGYALDDPSGGGAGTVPDQITYAGANQQWTVTLLSGVQYKIIAASGAALTSGLAPGTISGLASFTDVDQRWVFQPHPSGAYYNIISAHTGLALDDNNGASGATCNQVLWSTTNNNQKWMLINRGANASNYLSGGTISSNFPNTAPEDMTKAFDNDTATKWYVAGGGSSSPWAVDQFSSGKTVTSYKIGSGNDFPDRDPRTWRLEGSNNGTTWTTLDTQGPRTCSSTGPWPRNTLTTAYTISNTTAYTRYRVTFTATCGNANFQVSEVELFGY